MSESLLTSAFAQEICQIVSEETGYHLIFVNEEGYIFAANIKSRIGDFHKVGKEVMDGTIDEGVVTVEMAEEYQQQFGKDAPKAGINLPVIYKGERIANLGVSGDPDEIRPVLGLISRTITLWLENRELVTDMSSTIQGINDKLNKMMEKIANLTEKAQELANSSRNTRSTTSDSIQKVKNMEEVLGMIKTIGSQSQILGLNAGIEAARAGEAGKGFVVVAQEIRKLAARSEESVEKVNANLGEIQDVFGNIAEQVDHNGHFIEDQAESMTEIESMIREVEESMTSLIQRTE
ncbi:methyl-accepting chemotaxis protein [Salisediminibacterium selenitireducens]|uniref:methyl-accepting chemotaxis protein n=1 Tax=Salisediminibacterium selenitireducens TaxID=85683 RepID=UPI00015F950B|nr:methyl-accepting chemotaxis protein [Salisediminibacterium selenitireducens]